MPEDDDRPFVGDDAAGTATSLLERVLEHAEPESRVAGGPSESDFFSRRTRTRDELQTRRKIYENGGPITEFIDTRALMTYGVGVEFTTTTDTVTDDQGRTVAEWAADTFDRIDEHMIQRGIQTYVYGDAWVELVETRGGGFSHLHLIDPCTVGADWNAHGSFTDIFQVTEREGGRTVVEELDEDAVGHYWFKNVSGGPLGDSLIEQNRDEIMRFAQNQEQRANAIRLHGSPHYHIKVGSDGQTIADRLLRRVRDRFRSTDTDEKTNWVTGGDIEISELDAPGFEGMQSITETDVAMLASGFGIPLEWTNFGSAGLGEGTPAESRQLKFERQARAEQRRAADQFIREVLRPVLERYSPFPRDIDIEMRFGDVVSDQQATAEWMRDYKSYMTVDEVRERLDLGEVPDDADLGPPEGTPDAEGQDIGGGGGGLFTDAPADHDTAAYDDLGPQASADGGAALAAPGGPPRTLFHGDATTDDLTEEELVWEEVYDRVLWSGDDAAADRRLFEFDPEEVPEFVINRMEEAVRSGAVFENFETIPPWASEQVADELVDSLSQRQGWSINSLTERIQSLGLGIDKQAAETIARTETAALVNTARREGYEEEFAGEAVFKWAGPENSRTTEACTWLKEQTNPKFGGDPVTLERLQELIAEAPTHDADMDNDLARPNDYVVHINERHTFVRHVA